MSFSGFLDKVSFNKLGFLVSEKKSGRLCITFKEDRLNAKFSVEECVYPLGRLPRNYERKLANDRSSW